MTNWADWVRLDGDFPDHPKVVGLSDRAFRAFITGLCYCGRYLTDGDIPAPVAQSLARRPVMAELIGAGLWHQNGSGVVVHDYGEYQPTRAEVEELRRKRSDAGRLGGQRRRGPPGSKRQASA